MLATSCATAPAASPDVRVTQLSELASSDIRTSSGLPVIYQLEITNPFDHPVTLTSVEVETVGGSGAYAMKRVKHAFALEIVPHGTESIQFRAWVQPLQQTDAGESSMPVMMRGTARFKSAAGVTQTAFTARVQ